MLGLSDARCTGNQLSAALDVGVWGAGGGLAGLFLGAIIFAATHGSSLSLEQRLATFIVPAVAGLASGVGANCYRRFRAFGQGTSAMGVFRAGEVAQPLFANFRDSQAVAVDMPQSESLPK